MILLDRISTHLEKQPEIRDQQPAPEIVTPAVYVRDGDCPVRGCVDELDDV